MKITCLFEIWLYIYSINNNQIIYTMKTKLKISKDLKEVLTGVICFIIAFTTSMLIASTFFN